jgi:predicted permease
MVDEDYFAAMKIPLREGRVFARADNESSEPVIIVNEVMSTSFWPGQDALGKFIHTSGNRRRVIGIVGGVRYFGLEEESGSEMYLPIRQTGDFHVVDLVVKTAVPPPNAVASIRTALKKVDPHLPVTRYRTMRELVDSSVLPRRSLVLILTGFAGFGLILASLGIYAVISYSVNQRRQEIGIRMALGASPNHLQVEVLKQTLWLTGLGVLIGIPVSWMAARAIRALLFGVRFSDPLTYGFVLALLTAVGVVAGYLPARRAAQLNPLDAIRAEWP